MKESASLVILTFNNLFGSYHESAELFAILQTYKGAEEERVQLAILKLSDGDPEKLRHNVEAAKIDYRDVLAWAEHPEQMQTGASVFNSASDVIQNIMQRDKDQYQKWLSEQEEP